MQDLRMSVAMICLLAWPGALPGGENPSPPARDLWEGARRTAANPQADLADRLAAVGILGRAADSQDDHLRWLADLLVPQMPPQRPREGDLADRFRQLDRNGDGKVSAEEFPGPLFQQMDTDGDGSVTLDEARAFFAGWRAAQPTADKPASTPAARPDGGELQVLDAVFELCVRDVEACVKFYRDGIGMREVEPATDRYESKVYWNTGLHGARENHWLRLRFSGVTNAELIGARVEVREPGSGELLGTRWIHSNPSYKSGGALEAHFGLGKQTAADLKITLLSGKTASFAGVKADQFLDLNLTSSQSTPVKAETKP